MVGEISEDGLWIWDGEKWLPNGTFTPPAVNENLSTSPEALTESIISELKFLNSAYWVTSDAKQELALFKQKIQDNKGKLYPRAYLELCEYQYNIGLGEICSRWETHTVLRDMKKISQERLNLVQEAMRYAIKFDLESWEIVCKMIVIEINTDVASYDDNFHQYHSDEVKMNTYINQLETMQEGIHLCYAYSSLCEFYICGIQNEGFDQNIKSRIAASIINTGQKCLNVARKLENWTKCVDSYIMQLTGYLANPSPAMADYCYSEATKLMAEKNVSQLDGLVLKIIRSAELSGRGNGIGEQAQLASSIRIISEINGISESVTDLLFNGFLSISKHNPEITGFLSDIEDDDTTIKSQSSTTSSNSSLLDSIEVTVNGDRVGFSWSSALPGNVKEALRAMNDADQFASVDDLGKYVGISQFDEDTKIKLWSVWRQRLAEFEKIRGNQKQLEINSAASTAITVLFILIGAYFAGATDFYDDYKYLEDVYESNCVGGGVFADIGRDITGVSGDCQELKTFLEDKKWMLLFNPSIFCGLGLICLGIAASGIKWE